MSSVMAVLVCLARVILSPLYSLPKTQLSPPIVIQYLSPTQYFPLLGCLLSAHLRNLR